MKQHVIVLLIASFLAISSLGIGVTVITNASGITEEDNDTCEYDITVFKYYDENQNGIYDEGEEGLEEWYFELYGKGYENGDDRDHPPWYYLASGYTDSDGYLVFEDYQCGFPNDEIGHYKVREYIPEGWYNTGSAVYPTVEEVEETEVSITENGDMEMTILNGEGDYDRYVEDSFWLREPMTVEFGNAMMDGEITVYKYYDMNENGMFDEEEDYMLEDWMFNLWTTDDEGEPEEIIANGTTDANGELVFEEVYPGDYIVQEELKEDWEHTTDLLQPVTVYPVEESEVWFGNIQYGDITVNKYHDLNYNGERDEGEPWIDGFAFQLWEADEEGNPVETIGDPVITTNGTYTFEDLVAGDYIVEELPRQVLEEECCWLPTTEVLQHVYVKPGGEYNLYFGNVQGGRIEGMKFLDIEADGNFDVGLDKPLMGWEINLWTVEDGVPGEIIETTETNRDGMYYFNCVMPGEYFVQEEMYEGWYNNTADILHVYVEPCETTTDIDFSNCMYKQIYGIKFYDENMDGEFNEEDWVLEGWEINLWNEIDGEPGEIIETFYTQPNGYYYFEGLKVGTYYVQEEVPYGWDNTTESVVKIRFNCCSPKAIINFGNYEFPEITINKFNDVNMDGVYSIGDGDYLLADQTVNFDVLGDFEGVQVFAETLGVEGSYNFLVPVGDFNVTEVLDIGWLNTTPLWQEQTLGPGDHWEVWFGNVEYGDLEVYKFYDENMDGYYDEGEEMLEGWTFNLWNTTDEGQPEAIIATNVTDEDGLAMFESLESGLYAVQEI
ncbi:MAG: hypothetical protein KGY68_01095, partial [Candidatus Thermoplasmatota archaeon]|nr:hypothetical protein [Candidatus Thermoplasmatota archaeon]